MSDPSPDVNMQTAAGGPGAIDGAVTEPIVDRTDSGAPLTSSASSSESTDPAVPTSQPEGSAPASAGTPTATGSTPTTEPVSDPTSGSTSTPSSAPGTSTEPDPEEDPIFPPAAPVATEPTLNALGNVVPPSAADEKYLEQWKTHAAGGAAPVLFDENGVPIEPWSMTKDVDDEIALLRTKVEKLEAAAKSGPATAEADLERLGAHLKEHFPAQSSGSPVDDAISLLSRLEI